MLEHLADLLPETATACYAWAFLDNHAHFLFRSGPRGIAALMRRLLTGYVVTFNRRHRRHGQLFQNRYKSIVCQKDAYLKQLVAYIHLNPLRAELVGDMEALRDYRYCGHGAVLGRFRLPWQDAEHILAQFGADKRSARRRYSDYIAKNAAIGRQPELVAGGLRRGPTGWKQVKQRSRQGVDRVMGDVRILGGADFVHSVLSEARQSLDRRFELRRQGWGFEDILARAAALFDVSTEDVLAGGRQRPRALARSLTCYWAVRHLGLSTAEVARRFGMSTGGVSYAIARGEQVAAERKCRLQDD